MAAGYSRAQIEGIANTVFPRNTAFVDPMRPETSQVLQRILEESQSTDAVVRLLAIRRFKDIFQPFVRSASAESAVHAAVFLLERGFMKSVNQGLEESLAGRWLLLPSPEDTEKLSATANGYAPILLKPIICASAVECLAVDSRTAKYILKVSPRLPVLLKNLFLKEFTLGVELDLGMRPELQIKEAVLCAIPKLFYSEAFRKEIGQSTDFLAAVMDHAVADFQNKMVVMIAASVIHTARTYCFTGSPVKSLEESFLRFTAKIFMESSSKAQILYTIETLAQFTAHRVHSPTRRQEAAPEIPMLRSSVLALLLCQDELQNFDDSMRLAIFAGFLTESTALARNGTGCFLGSQFSMVQMKESAREDRAAVQRASQLRKILLSNTEREERALLYPVKSADRDATMEEALKRGLTLQDRRASTVDQGARKQHGKRATSKLANKRRPCGTTHSKVYRAILCTHRESTIQIWAPPS
ncbi:hypothetical protein KFL_001500010 [Klebsormidium nitens]|uniref:Uncharacterized protein n=1 Tax=Klebsormidium nitens TaxID=105231 RepID=A0A1Y1I2R1_KLENI|nr:hypothetical protein KFL_001500010 [Klebsormidium nitens]|eukprot:GAQ83471.1 hypothetical protein KFL_001500010 [Klebsormidium nitens]